MAYWCRDPRVVKTGDKTIVTVTEHRYWYEFWLPVKSEKVFWVDKYTNHWCGADGVVKCSKATRMLEEFRQSAEN